VWLAFKFESMMMSWLVLFGVWVNCGGDWVNFFPRVRRGSWSSMSGYEGMFVFMRERE
jgi:hypothetical protein